MGGERSDAKFSFADMQKGIGDSAREWLFCPPCGWRRLACKAAPLFTTLLHTRTLVKLGSGDLGRDVNSLASVPSAPLRGGGAVRGVALASVASLMAVVDDVSEVQFFVLK